MNGLTSLSRLMLHGTSSDASASNSKDTGPRSSSFGLTNSEDCTRPTSSPSTAAAALAVAAAAGEEDDMLPPSPITLLGPTPGGNGAGPRNRMDMANGAGRGELLNTNGTGGQSPAQGIMRQGRPELAPQRPAMGPRGGMPPSPTGSNPQFNQGHLGSMNGMNPNAIDGDEEIAGMGIGATGMHGKRKQMQYDFRYDDSDTTITELSEFFAYSENSQLGDWMEEWKVDWGESTWTGADLNTRRSYIDYQLEMLEHRNAEVRLAAAKRLLYLTMGNYGETAGPEHQLHWIMENAKLTRQGIASIIVAFQDVLNRYDVTNARVSENRQSFSGAGPSSGQPYYQPDQFPELQAINLEVSIYLALLYFVVEVFRSDEQFGDELMALDPPLPVFLLQTVSSLRDRPWRDFPTKKLLLLLWKTLLTSLGGLKDVRKAVALQRDLNGLLPIKTDFVKVNPMGLSQFHKDITIKYPSFTLNPSKAPVEKLAEAVQPIPIRTSYHTDVEEGLPRTFVSREPSRGAMMAPQPGTPAPSPPPTPKKKQQYQTDNTKPFVFPFTNGFSTNDGTGNRLVPYAVEEAEKLYADHLHVTLALHQLDQTRKEYLLEESGLGRSGLIGFTESQLDDEWDDKEWMAYQSREWTYEEQEEICRAKGDKAGVAIAQQARASLKRLYRVEVIYRSTLVQSQSLVIVLLKHLLATVTSTSPATNAQLNTNDAVPGRTAHAAEQSDDLTLPVEELDLIRYREITAKAVSAIILLLLKWFKASHVMKYQHLSSLLVDSNCLLLILKLFGFQDLAQIVQTKNDKEDLDLFNFCEANFSPDGAARSPATKPANNTSFTKFSASGEEIEMINIYSWRSFFSTMNFCRILHQLTKQRSARISLLVQYKSSILRIIKSQVPYCGRKWRASNMKTITAIYLSVAPELRDEWLTVLDMDAEMEEGQAIEHTLRLLLAFYHRMHYGRYLASASAIHAHKRSHSLAAGAGMEDLSISSSHSRPSSLHRADSDVFPPNKTRRASSGPGNQEAPPSSIDFMIGSFLYEYEDLISEVLGAENAGEMAREHSLDFMESSRGPASGRDDPTWQRLNEIMRGRGMTDDATEISDSESIGPLVTDGRFAEDDDMASEDEEFTLSTPERRKSQGQNTWEHISPELSLLPKSPNERPRRRSSSGSGSPLRPLMFAQGDQSLGSGWLDHPLVDEEDEDGDEPGPIPKQEGTEDAEMREHHAVDEVEAYYNV